MADLVALTPAEQHRAMSGDFGEHVAAVADWDAPTPVDGWVARDIVAHLVDWFTGFLDAGGIELAGGPSVAGTRSKAVSRSPTMEWVIQYASA